MSTAVTTTAMSWAQIDTELQQLLDLREDAEAEGALPEELKAIDDQILEYQKREVRKVDGTANAMRSLNEAADLLEKEAQRLHERAKDLRTRSQRIKDATLYAMQVMGITKVSTPHNTLRVQTNGGLQAIETDACLIPKDLLLVNLNRLPSQIWTRMWGAAKNALTEDERAVMITCVEFTPDTEAIREALKQRVPCLECKGHRGVPGDLDCPRCEGKGTVQNSIPGARLLPRGSHLRVE